MSEYKHFKRSVDIAMSLSRSSPISCQAPLLPKILPGYTPKTHTSARRSAANVDAASLRKETISPRIFKPISTTPLPMIFANQLRNNQAYMLRHQVAKAGAAPTCSHHHGSRAFHRTALLSTTLDGSNSSVDHLDHITSATLKRSITGMRPSATTFESQELQLLFPVPSSVAAAQAIANLRLLIHSEKTSSSLDSGSREYQRGLVTEQRMSSPIIPPLSALRHLFTYIKELRNLDFLSGADWEAMISWFFYHKDYQMLDQIHLLVLDQQDIAMKCSAESFARLVRSSLRDQNDTTAPLFESKQGHEDVTGLTATELDSGLTKLGLLQKTLDQMRELDLPQSEELYALWLRAAVHGENWDAGIEAWRHMGPQKQNSQPSVSLMSLVTLCYFHKGNYHEAGRLFKTIIERSTVAQHRQNYAMFADGGASTGPSNSAEEGGEELGLSDGKAEFLRRQKQAIKGVTLLVEKTKGSGQQTPQSSASTLTTGSVAVTSHEWVALVFPALIEAICLDKKESLSAKLAMEMTEALSKEGYELDKARFRILCRFIGAAQSSEESELFLRRWLEATRSTSSTMSPLPLSEDDSIQGTANNLNGSRKAHRIRDQEARSLAEVGLQEVLKHAVVEGEFVRVRKILEGMSLLDMNLGATASTKVLNGLCDGRDYRTAMMALEKIIQERRIPSANSASKLLHGLIRSDRLDESVAMFRDLTENHGLQPSAEMLRNLMSLTAKYGRLPMTQRILTALKHMGVQRDGEIYCNLMRCYVRADNIQGAIKIFENMESAGVRNEAMHFNVLLEGAIRGSSPLTALGVLEIMTSQSVHPSPETWNILLSGAFQSGDRVLSHQIFHELSRSVTEGALDTADMTLRASRHPETFQLLMGEFAERHGIDSALGLLKTAQEAGYAPHVKASMYRDLMERSCQESNGVAGYELYKLLRQIDGSDNGFTESPTQEDNYWASLAPSTHPRRAIIPAYSAMSVTSTSWTVTPPPLANIYSRILDQLEQENRLEMGKDMATDLILSGFDMDQGLVQRAIAFYARCGELPAAFGLYMRMGRAYGVEPTRVMVNSLYSAACDHGLLKGQDVSDSYQITSSDAWDDATIQQWLRVLKASMETFNIGVES